MAEDKDTQTEDQTEDPQDELNLEERVEQMEKRDAEREKVLEEESAFQAEIPDAEIVG